MDAMIKRLRNCIEYSLLFLSSWKFQTIKEMISEKYNYI